MPILVHAAPGANHGALTLDIPERQIMVNYPNDNFLWHHRILILRLDGSRWLVITPTRDCHEEDFAGVLILPLGRASQFPAEERPYFCFSPLDDAALGQLRGRANQLADVLGAGPVPPPQGPTHAQWFFADTASRLFSTEVPHEAFANPHDVELKGSAGLVLFEEVDGAAPRWLHIERIRPTDFAQWVREKREGAGRDARLLPAAPRVGTSSSSSSAVVPLFRDVVTLCRAPAAGTMSDIFDGPSSMVEVSNAMAASGLEPQAYALQFINSSGLAPKSALANEICSIVLTVHLLGTRDRVDFLNLYAAEHLARRLLQIQAAVRRNPKNPDFEGLEPYLAHSRDTSGLVRAPAFDKHVAEIQRAEAQVMKQRRQAREEQEANNKHKNDKGGKNNNKNKDKEDA